MQGIQEKIDGYKAEMEGIVQKHKETSEVYKNSEDTLKALINQYNDKRSRVAELEEILATADPISVNNQPNA
tara:strand:- start:384 stop:599 length:216 start_codon:yes stop_codon:yes gene_type:complete